MADPVEIRPSHMCHVARCGCSSTNGTSLTTDILWKDLTPPVSPIKVTKDQWKRHGEVGYDP